MAIGVSSGLVLTTALLLSQTGERQIEFMSVNQIQILRGQILANLNNSDAWDKTIELNSAGGKYSGGKMDCLANGTPCTKDGTAAGAPIQDQPFASVDSLGTLDFDATNPSAGFNLLGTPCNGFSSVHSSPCLFRYDLKWTANCIPGNCVNPQVKVRATLQIAPGIFSLLNLMNYSIADFYWTPTVSASTATPMIMTWNTNNISAGSSLANQAQLPLVVGGSYNFVVDWGDGNNDTIAAWNAPNTLHTYAAAGTYTIKLTGHLDQLSFNNTGDRLKILDVKAWGNNAWKSMSYAFAGCANLAISATDAPDLSNVTVTSGMFQSASAFNSSIGHWNTSTVKNMSGMFGSAISFNQNIGGWNTAAVTDMSNMFNGATVFNQNIGGWNTAAVTNMSNLFANTSAFNQNIGGWNTAAVTNMSGMFVRALAFNQNIGGWNTAAVTNMSDMFGIATAFNQDIGAWNTAAVKNMSRMFTGASSFNKYIGGWNTAAVTDMSAMFNSAQAFNQNIGGWNTSAVKNMSRMFAGTLAFNQNIAGWDTSAVTDMNFMFSAAKVFNQNIGGWNTSQVTNMSYMFQFTQAFNQNIGGWDTSAVTNMAQMFRSTSAFNQDISGWNTAAVTDMSAMFAFSSAFNQDLSTWDVGAVTNYANYRQSAPAWTLPKPPGFP
jgi:surface protein